MVRLAAGLAAVVMYGWAVPALAAQRLESVEKEIAARTANLRTVQFDSHMVNEGMPGRNAAARLVVDGQSQLMRKDGRTLSRVDSRTRIGGAGLDGEAKREGQEISSLMISNGQYMYQLTDMGGRQMAVRNRVDPKMGGADPLDPADAFKIMSQHFALKVLPDQVMDDRDCWVIEATSRDVESPNPIARNVMYYDKKTGLPVRTVGYDKEGRVLSTLTIRNIRINEPIPVERFIFKAPPGVEVMDATPADDGAAASTRPAAR